MLTDKTSGNRHALNALAVVAIWMTAAASPLIADTLGVGQNDPEARFRGPLTYDFGVTNVKWEAATPEYSYVTFDLYWSHSWRAKWTEPAKTSVTGKDIEMENWDAAWVFVKFLPEKDSGEAQERNHWLHATLDRNPANHVMPAGATNVVKLSDDGTRGMGVFIYRDAIGHGVNDWKKIKLRWNHPAPSPDKSGNSAGTSPARFDPAKADVKVHAIAMVYVPEGAFKVGSGRPSGIYAKFADGPDFPVVNNMANCRSKDQEFMGLTDGSWRGGNSIPFLLDAEWNAPAKEGTRARRLGNHAGELWGTFTFWEVNLGWIGAAGPIPDEHPTGYAPFYCMKYDLTQGQYVDFLNSLPPDVAAERAFIGTDPLMDGGSSRTRDVTIDVGSRFEPYVSVEKYGCTLYSSADFKEKAAAEEVDATSEEEKKKKAAVDSLIGELFDDKKAGKKRGGAHALSSRPIYAARLPFRRLMGLTSWDNFAYAVWAGMRPMSTLEGNKAGNGPRDPLAPPDWTVLSNLTDELKIADEGLPTERYLQGHNRWASEFSMRVGCRSTPTSDRGTAMATYWGITELEGPTIPLVALGFRGTHGSGMTSPGKPGGSVQRSVGTFDVAPPDWVRWWSYLGGHYVDERCRLVVSADNRILKPVAEPAAAAKPKAPLPIPPLDGRKDDWPRVTNVKVEPGKEFSTVSFDLAWNNSWRAKWTEPAEKNCTGKPLALESWDAAWVFVKFRKPDTPVFSHATLSPDAAHHGKPAGAALDMGLSDDPAGGGAGGAKGIGVFIYRDAVGQGANDFKGIKLRWQNGGDQADAATAEISVHAIAMVYVPEGPFRSKNPFIYAVNSSGSWSPGAYVCPLTTITTPDTMKPGGHVNSCTNYVREGLDWPNGYGAFYCMKYSISQGEYARFLTEAAPDPATASYNGQYGYGPHNAFRRYARALYGLNGYTILYSAGEGRYEADVPERPANFLSDADINSFTAWAGLRPMTKLEYEKVCRGPRAVVKDEDAWAPGACAPAVGLAQVVPSIGGYHAPTTGRLAWPGLSYWGIRDMSQSGAVIEWPAVVLEDGRGFPGNHGTGTPDPPGGWPFTSRCEWYAIGMWQGFPLSEIGIWLLPEDCTSMPGDIGAYVNTRSGRYGARAVRSATARNNKDSPLQVEALPNLTGYDIAIVNLAGKFRNDGDKPLRVGLDSALPAACFLQGAASRVFTAAANTVTPFKMPVVLTRAVTNATGSGGRVLLLPLAIKEPGGEARAEASVRLAPDVLSRPLSIAPSLDGGAIELKVKNATETPLTVTFEMLPPPVVKLGQTKQRLAVAAGGDGKAAFPVPKQWFPQEGLCRIPYRLTIGNGAPMDGETAVDLRMQTRWWVKKTVRTRPKVAGAADVLLPGSSDDVVGFEGVFSEAGDVYTLAAPAKGWKAVLCGSAFPLGEAGPLPSRESKATGATRVLAAGDVDAVVDARANGLVGSVDNKPVMLAFLRVWFNEDLVFDSHVPEKERKPRAVRIRKGVNTLVAEWESNVDGASAAQDVKVEFNDAKTGKPVPDLVLDMDRK